MDTDTRVKGPGRCLQKIWRHRGFNSHCLPLWAASFDRIKHGVRLASHRPLALKYNGCAGGLLRDWKAKGCFLAFKKDGRPRAFQHSPCPRLTAAGDWPRQQEGAVPRDGLWGRFRPEASVSRLWNPPRVSAFVEPWTVSPTAPLHTSRPRIRKRVLAPAERRTHLS